MFLAVDHHGPEHQALLRMLRDGHLDRPVVSGTAQKESD
jgi:hypothetical protein